MATFKIKRGDTLSFLANIKNINGEPVINEASNIKSDIATENEVKLAAFTITATSVEGQYLFQVLDTNSFPIDTTLFTDIQYSSSGVINSSATMTIQVVKDVTRWHL